MVQDQTAETFDRAIARKVLRRPRHVHRFVSWPALCSPDVLVECTECGYEKMVKREEA